MYGINVRLLYLRDVLEFRNGIGITDKCQTSANRNHFGHVLARLVGQIAQYGENSDATKKASGSVHEANNHRIPDTFQKKRFL